MNYIVSVEWSDKDCKWNEEFYKFVELEDAQEFSNTKADEMRKRDDSGEIRGFSILIYEVTNY